MRILVYPHDLNMGGSQMNAIELAAAVSRLGHQCSVFGERGTLCERIEELGLEFIESPDPGRRPSPRLAGALRNLVRDRGFDIIHGYEWPPALEAAMAAEGLPDVAAVSTVMSMAVAPFIPQWMPLVVGTQQISAAEQAGGRFNVSLIEPPVDLEHNKPLADADVEAFRRTWGLGELPVVACVSRLVPELKAEGILTAIRVAGELASTSPFQLLVVGDGRARPAMEELAATANAAAGRQVVFFTGELKDPRPAYAAADIVLGMGGSALRALAFGKALIVQGERGYFKTLQPESLHEFRWQGWYGVGDDVDLGTERLSTELSRLLSDADLRSELGEYSRRIVQDFSLETAARRQVTIYRDALASRSAQKRQLGAAAQSLVSLGSYYVNRKIARLRGTSKSDDFNAKPIAHHAPGVTVSQNAADSSAPIVYFPGVSWDTLAGTDRQLVSAMAQHRQIIWVDTPQSLIRKRDRTVGPVSHPLPGVVRLRPPAFVGVQRPVFRDVANWGRAWVARSYVRNHGLRPRAVIAATTAPMLKLARNMAETRVYYATDDFVAAAPLWNVSQRYLAAAREKNLEHADLVMAVTEDLARHLQRRPVRSRWLPNGADVERFAHIEEVPPAALPLAEPVVGVVGQFNSRTDLTYLEAIPAVGLGLLLVGPRWFTTEEDDEAFDRLVSAPGVHWVGEVPRDQLAPHLRAMAVGLTPYADSLFNQRSYPLKTLEYLAAGLPVVSTTGAPATGLDPRFVAAASTPEEFAARAAAFARESPESEEIRQSVRTDGWSSRAEVLLSWL